MKLTKLIMNGRFNRVKLKEINWTQNAFARMRTHTQRKILKILRSVL